MLAEEIHWTVSYWPNSIYNAELIVRFGNSIIQHSSDTTHDTSREAKAEQLPRT